MTQRPTIVEASRDGLALLRACAAFQPFAVFEAVNGMDLIETQAVISFLVGAATSALRRLAEHEGCTVDDLIATALEKLD